MREAGQSLGKHCPLLPQPRRGGAYLPDAPLSYLVLQPLDQLGDIERSLIAFGAVADGHGAGGLLLVANHEHVRNLLQLCLTNLVADFLRTIVSCHPESLGFQLAFDPAAQAKSTILGVMPEGERDAAALAWEECEALIGPVAMGELLGYIRTLKSRKRSEKPLEHEVCELFELHRSGREFVAVWLKPLAASFDLLRETPRGHPAQGALPEGAREAIRRMGWSPFTRRSMRALIRGRWRARSLSICAVSCSFKWVMGIKSKPRLMSRSRCRRMPSPFRRAMFYA